ncbi:MAG TPA: T9SS type A sorting domain-containing protein [Saprospiraceae bacterium]|nr:T9SS type A sorting domain-containing protein [Saprospiraceae bacterium]
MKKLLLVPVLLTIALAASAQTTYTFVGGGANNNWSTAANWICVGPDCTMNNIPPTPLPAGDFIIITANSNQNGGARTIEGTMTVNAGVTMTNANSLTIADGGSLINEGIIIRTSQTIITGTMINNGILTLQSSALNITAGGTVTNNNDITIVNPTLNVEGNLINEGTITNQSGLLRAQVVGMITNNGTIINNNNLRINNNAVLSNNGQIENGNSFNINNDGIVNNNATGSITNSGTINNSNDIFNSGIITNSGTISTGNNQLFENTGTLIMVGGTLSRGGNAANINNDGLIQGTGTISLSGANPFINNGTIDMSNGATGTLAITGTGNFTNNGTIILEVGSSDASDLINVGNTATLGGTLIINDIVGGGAFTEGTFTLITASSLTGTFSSIQYPNSDPSWDPEYNNTSFVLNYGPAAAPLPIELLSFGGRQVGAAIQLHWETATERDNDYVEVQRSHDGKRFEALGRVPGAGNSATPLRYTFADVQPLPGVNYYRLRQVDFDGQQAFHPIIAVRFDDKNAPATGITVFPTFVSEDLNIRFAQAMENAGTLLVSDLNGRILLQRTLGAGTEQTQVNVSSLPAGHYIVVVHNRQQSVVTRFMKQ